VIKIFTFAVNHPEFLRLQMRSFQRYLEEDFEFVIFNNALFDYMNGNNAQSILMEGQSIGATVIDVEKDQGIIDRCQEMEKSCSIFNRNGQYSNANVAHAYALCWAWEKFISEEKGPIAILDSDIFLIEPTKLTEAIQYEGRCIIDGRTHRDGRVFRYMWPTLFLADMARLPNPKTLSWWCGQIEGVPVDVGGQTHHYLKAHPEIIIEGINREHFSDSESCEFHPANYDEFYLNGATILHYRCGSNWDQRSREYHEKKTAWLKGKIG